MTLDTIIHGGKLVSRDSTKLGLPLVNWVNLTGVVVGIALMYFTAFFVKF